MDYFFLAYIDPGSGALLLQTLVAGAVGGLVFCRHLLANITSRLFKRGSPEAPPAEDLNPPER